MQRLRTFIKSEAVLLVSFFLAGASSFIVKPSQQYFSYVDFRTLSLLFCLMAVMAGLGGLGVFRSLAAKLLGKVKTVRSLSLTLCLLCFFSSMVITNDVALITFVPFSITALKMSGKTGKLIALVTLETVAANLGSMLTPIGNPQNLFLFSAYEMSGADFFLTVAPYAVLSLALIAVSTRFLGKESVEYSAEAMTVPDRRRIAVYAALFLLALLTVMRIVPYGITLAVTAAVLAVFDRGAIKKVDYSLLLTFVFLFIFIGNLGNIEYVNGLLHRIVGGHEVAVGVIASQVFSNVPAAILLSGFTSDVKSLLIGVNLGGLGTLIASMASLISFKLIAKENVRAGKYIAVFTAVNAVFLILNLLLWLIIK